MYSDIVKILKPATQKERMEKPWETKEFVDFLNDINELAKEKYGWNICGHGFDSNNFLQVIFMPAIGADADNRKF